jgi:uncharacterized membrane protein
VLADTAVVSLAVADSDTERDIEVPAVIASEGRAVSDMLGLNVLAATAVVSLAVAVSDTERKIELTADVASSAVTDSETDALYTTPLAGIVENGAVENGAKPNI